MPNFSAVEIPKLKDWQAFQRACVPLFRQLVNDPTLREYGRHGQAQDGIDLIGYRDGRVDAPVAVQCRAVERLTAGDVTEAVDKARKIAPPLTEIIFATTAPNDASLDRHALQLTEHLRGSGWTCRVTVLGWETLQNAIATCPAALAEFWPGLPTVASPDPLLTADVQQIGVKLDLLVSMIARGDTGVAAARPEHLSILPAVPDGAVGERRDVHLLISTYRDLANRGHTETAIRELDKLRSSSDTLEPFARYRIDAIIGSAHLRARRPAQALTALQAALARRPDDPTARANLALAVLVSGDSTGARTRCREVLATEPSHVLATAVYVQASLDDPTVVDPWALVPASTNVERDVLMAVAMFFRGRRDARWHDVARDALNRYPTDLLFIRWTAESRLDAILTDSGALYGAAVEADVVGEVVAATRALASAWHPSLDEEAPDPDLLVAGACNLAGAYRWLGQTAEAETVIARASAKVGASPELVRAQALLLLEAAKPDAALAVIGPHPATPDLALLSVEIVARTDPAAARHAWDTLPWAELPNNLARAALRLRLGLALDEGDVARATKLLDDLVAHGETAVWLAWSRARVAVARSRLAAAVGGDGGPVPEPLASMGELSEVRELVVQLRAADDVEFGARVAGAQFVDELGLHDAAVQALRGRVGRNRDSVALRCYVSASIAAGLVREAVETLNGLPDQVRALPFFRHSRAAVFWNAGDLPAAEQAFRELRESQPDRLDVFLRHISCLLRQGRAAEAAADLAEAQWPASAGDLDEQVALARLLGQYGQPERAVRLAYRLFVTHRDQPTAWMCLLGVVMTAPRGTGIDLEMTRISNDAEFMLASRSGESREYTVEDDPEVRRYTFGSVPSSHPDVRAALGHAVGDTFVGSDGTAWSVRSVRSKFLSAYRTALAQYQAMFPDAGGLARIRFDPEAPDGLTDVTARVKARAAHVRAMADEYGRGHLTLGALAFRTGVDPVEAMLGLREVGVPFRVAHGFHHERATAAAAVQGHAERGCLVDGPTLHLIRRLDLVKVVTRVCGRIGVTQGTVDGLRERRRALEIGGGRHVGSLHFANDRLTLLPTAPEQLDEARAMLESDLIWIGSEATVVPALAKFDLPTEWREIIQLSGAALFDDVLAANGSERLLLVEDLAIRQLASAMGVPGAWLQPVLMIARERRFLSEARYTEVLVALLEIGETYIAIDGSTLLAAVWLDAAGGALPGRHLRAIGSCLGGADADVPSQLAVVVDFLRILWNAHGLESVRAAATGHTLEQLLRARTEDHGAMLARIVRAARGFPALQTYIAAWTDGHFLRPTDGRSGP